MCGFLGAVSRQPELIKSRFEAALNLMEHRGPDYAATWQSESGQVLFGHRRLSIIDLDARSHQPFHRPDWNLSIVFNGEIYNHAEIRKELIGLGYSFHTSSDTEVLLGAYHSWGKKMLPKLRGMFAFLIYDHQAEKLFGARDRGGEKPFYYSVVDGDYYFGSELKSILALPKVSRDVNPLALDYLLAYGYGLRDQSIFQDIKKILPGHSMELDISSGVLSIEPYWHAPAYKENAKSEEELTNELYTLMLDAIGEQLEADVPVGVLLSGGVDSSLVTAIAAETGKNIRTFTVGFPNEAAFDESSYAKLVSNHFGTEHHQLDIEEINFELIGQLANQFDDPIFDASMLPTYLVTKLVKEHCTVALGGDAGDELFGGYRWYNDLQNKAAALRRFPSFLSPLGNALLDLSSYKEHPKRFWIESFFSKSNKLPFTPGFLSKEDRNSLFPFLGALEIRAEQVMMREHLDGIDFVDKFTRVDFRHYMPDDVLVKVDRSSMMNSLEMRAPFLDHRIIDFAFSEVPSHFKADGKERKILLKRLSAKVLPKDFDASRKQGFGVPVESWLTEGKWKTNYEQEIASGKNKSLRNYAESENNGIHRFGLLMLDQWIKKYEVNLG